MKLMKKKRIVKLPLLEHSRQTVMHRTKKFRFDAGVKCTVNDLIDAPLSSQRLLLPVL